ncbi:DEAD/DEAH box helicase [Streptomyces sp. 3MP-14]|uniref:DEAD/DEAH box helicase n=1 Tax=Streptomyces mimosae TaxID=2586635 RepID=A0A5N6ARJ7_9ACTN|nr:MULTISPECIES: protein DpdJ [Streptomyces]KAB8170795.1 DEAD/DEAH box helicase [Streptomyces mimosae]KAB8179852.1 DEAD/DEAH box helicase [Streptomyces sp. 3MP-14]
MTDPFHPRFANELLNRLENRELPLLSWGITDTTLSEAEVLDTIDDVLHSHKNSPTDVTSREVLEDFLDGALLFQVPVPVATPPRYRTRLAESVRLTVGLRQLFAQRGWADQPDPGWWQQQRRLIADYRLYVAPRRYPRRDIPVMDALRELASLPSWDAVRTRVTTALLQDRDLARFQVDAARMVFSSLDAERSRGVIVGAGTGSGKTLAFYLPAFAAMASRGTGQRRVRTLALYPRKELLRDQLRTAIQEADTVDEALRRDGQPPLRIGALYGDTPWHRNDDKLKPNSRFATQWRRTRNGVICPYLPCPAPRCGTGDLEWADQDIWQGLERLTCTKCGYVLANNRLALTRESLQKNPPDLLFTTTEMLNRYSGKSGLDRLLGWRGGNAAPSLVLLDEVHTYGGLHGAQVALLLRRWREAVGRPVTFVGLSATLRDADAFLAQLVGLHPGEVTAVEPAAEDLVEEGREYALALRGDPVSGASLLSTSIQTAMLHGRLLDRESSPYLYGSTGFLFTDDLDVTNRFYNDLRDAEGGQDRTGSRRPRSRKPVLAGLRSSIRDERVARYLGAQSWDIVEKIGHDLDPDLQLHYLRIGRTSSQDVGVDRHANLTVATASLEVGFNDPRVGLVLQHKAPRDPAAFIQRRGRAGRTRGTRPVTIVTLSDYGRDRLAYQAYETLFSPEVPARSLPVTNRFVLKIQATQSFLDWTARVLRRQGEDADPREILKAPKGRRVHDKLRKSHDALTRLLDELLRKPDRQDELARHLRWALRVSADEVQALLWEQPRSLMLAVVPTALRRLRSEWTPLSRDPGDEEGALLPEFVTRALFEPLNLPEVTLILPFPGQDGEEYLPIARALREAVPGRVSRRFGHRRDDERTWLPVPRSGVDTLELPEIVDHAEPEGMWQPHGPRTQEVMVFRPHSLKLSEPPPNVADQSQGFPLWGSQIVVPEDAPPTPADVPNPSPWRSRVAAVNFATHAAGNPIVMRRMTVGADCEVAFQKGEGETRRVFYEVQGRPAALGFSMDVDAARFVLRPLETSYAQVRQYLSSAQWRSLAFSYALDEDPSLAELSNRFQREWLRQIYLTAFALEGLDGQRSAPEIHTRLARGAWARQLSRIIAVLYRGSDPDQMLTNSRLLSGLTELVGDQRVLTAVDRAAELLVAQDVADRTEDLAQRAYRDTLAAAILAAAQRACPDSQDGDLIVDVLPGADSDGGAVVWLSETSLGSLGVIEGLVRFYEDDPRRFWSLVTAVLAPSDHEYVDAALTRLLRHLTDEPDGDAAIAVANLRDAQDSEDSKRALDSLLDAWETLDGRPRHGAVSAFSARLLRPGSGSGTDVQTLTMVDAWAELEKRLGVEVDARVIAYAVGDGKINVGGGRPLSADQAFSLLWPRGRQARTLDLQHYQPYADEPVLDRLLVRTAHDDRVPRVDVTAAEWVTAYQKTMSKSAAVDLVCPAGATHALAQAVIAVPGLRVDRDVMGLFGEVRGYVRNGNEVCVRVELREAVQ